MTIWNFIWYCKMLKIMKLVIFLMSFKK